MELIDTHVHLLYPEQFTYPWCAATPELTRGFSLEHYGAAAATANAVRITSFVYVEADVPESQQHAETEFFSKLTNPDGGQPAISAMVGAAWPESAGFAARLEHVAQNSQLRGVRRVLHTMPDDLVDGPRFTENLRRLPEFALSFELCLRPHLLPAATRLATRCPDVQFILDHCGVPDVARGELDPWRNNLRLLAARPNVICKFSGLASVSDPARPLTPQVRPYFEHCLECFSPQRLMWGSDWPVSHGKFEFAAWLQTTAELLASVTAAERAAIGTGTARRIYRLPD